MGTRGGIREGVCIGCVTRVIEKVMRACKCIRECMYVLGFG